MLSSHADLTAAQAASNSSGGFLSDPFSLVFIVILVLLVVFMFRNSRKRQRDQQENRSKMVPGAQVMTNFGLFGTLLSINEEDNTALIETSPGTVIKVHRQVLARVVEPGPEAAGSSEESAHEPSVSEKPVDDTEPQYGERVAKSDGTSTSSSDESSKNDN